MGGDRHRARGQSPGSRQTVQGQLECIDGERPADVDRIVGTAWPSDSDNEVEFAVGRFVLEVVVLGSGPSGFPLCVHSFAFSVFELSVSVQPACALRLQHPRTFAEFEVDLLRLRTNSRLAVARAKGKPNDRQPKLSKKQQLELRRMHDAGDHSITDLAEVFSISRPSVYRTLKRSAPS